VAVPSRLQSIDSVRGLIIIFMALDHIGMLMVRRHSSEYWGGVWTQYDDTMTLQFILRLLSHLCAPGFFLWMGFGMAKMIDSRMQAGWSAITLHRFFLIRGLVLILISQFIETPAWVIGLLSANESESFSAVPGSGPDPYINISVIFALGSTMVVLGALPLKLQRWSWVWLVLAVSVTLVCYVLVPDASQVQVEYQLWQRMLLVAGQAGPVLVVYPLLPWLAIACLGMALGSYQGRYGDKVFPVAAGIGLVMVVFALFLRWYGGFGNFRLPRDNGVIEFLNVIKYPPSIIFVAWMVGINLMLAGLFVRKPLAGSAIARALAVYGKAPLFFYIAHLYLFAVLGALLFRDGTSYAMGIGVGAVGLIALYFGCQRYEQFKLAKPATSFWRML